MSIEKQNPQPIAKTESELEQSMPEFAETRDAIINLEVAANKIRLRDKKIEDINQKISTELPKLKIRLDRLAEKYPESEGLRELVRMYEDIRQDFEMKREIRVDTSLGDRLIEVRESIKKSGITSKAPESIDDPKIKELVEKMQRLGIPIDRVTTRAGADKTVILIAWAHPNLGMSEEVKKVFGVLDSQNDTNDYVSKLSSSKIANLVFTEGIPAGAKTGTRLKILAKMSKNGFQFVDSQNIQVEGVENKAYLLKTITGSNLANYQIRTTINNVVMANNIKKATRPGQTVIALMGAAHEFEIGSKNEHMLPYSQAIAFEANADVVVINTAKTFEEALRDPSKLELLKQATANFQVAVKKQIQK